MSGGGLISGDAEAEVRVAAADLVAAFGAHDTDRYFAAFAEDATFLFPTEPRFLATRAEYEERWRAWEADGVRVLDCRTSDTEVRLVGEGMALLTHRVRTRLRVKGAGEPAEQGAGQTAEHAAGEAAGEEEELRERETVLFRRAPDGRWLVIHEHLSPEP
ncbi:nuclear transport factor 2 family protein [Streptomyces flavidovirens]|uniref:YybH family protein n=1 Tax=Streptomyces flavidovirens TaxID=67298 RepID=UPI00341936EC